CCHEFDGVVVYEAEGDVPVANHVDEDAEQPSVDLFVYILCSKCREKVAKAAEGRNSSIRFGIVLSPDAKLAVLGCAGPTYIATLRNGEYQAILGAYIPQQDRVTSLSFAGDNRRLAVAH